MPHQWRIEDQEDVDFLSAIRKGDWKLVYRMHDARLELYNLKKDLSEKHDVSAMVDPHPCLCLSGPIHHHRNPDTPFIHGTLTLSQRA